MDYKQFKSLLHNTKGQAELGGIVVTIVVVALMGIVGISIFNQANKAALSPINAGQPLLDLAPLVVAAIVVIGGVASLLIVFRRGM